MTKFKVGDEVEIISQGGYGSIKNIVGKIGVITRLIDQIGADVEVGKVGKSTRYLDDNNFNLHFSCNEIAPSAHVHKYKLVCKCGKLKHD